MVWRLLAPVPVLLALLAAAGATPVSAGTEILGASLLTWLVFRATAWLPRRTRIRALLPGRRWSTSPSRSTRSATTSAGRRRRT